MCLVPILWSHVTTEMSMSDQEFDFFFQLNIVIYSVSMIFVELVVLGHVSFFWVRLHLRQPP